METAYNSHKQILFCVLLSFIAISGSCPAEDGGTTRTSASSDEGAGSSQTDEEVTTGTEPPAQCDAKYPLPPVQTAVLKPLVEELVEPIVHCAGLPTLDHKNLPGQPFPVVIYRPVAWAQNARWPLLIFAPGANQAVTEGPAALYDHVLAPLAQSGFVVVAIDPKDRTWSVAQRYSAMLCTLLWLDSTLPGGWTEAGNNRLNCDVVAMGHSRGGEAAFRLIDRFPDFIQGADVPAWRLRAVVGISPLSLPPEDNADPADSSNPIPPDLAVPYLAINGANDEDVLAGSSARAYDILAPEAMSPPSAWDKVSIWAYGVPHCAWGGQTPGDAMGQCDASPQERARATAVASSYISAFLDWQILEVDVPQNRRYFSRPVELDAAAVPEDFPPEVLDPSLWSDISPQFAELSGRPVIVEDLEPGTCEDPDARLRLDTMDRAGGPFPCGAQALAPSTLGEDVSLVGLTMAQVCLSPAEVFSGHGTSHATDVMQVRWGGPLPSGEVRWRVDASLLAYSHVSLRVGQGHGAGLPDDGTMIDLVLTTEDPEGTPVVASVTLTPVLQQDNSSGVGVSEIMRSFRIPLRLFVAQGAVLDHTKELIVRFPGDVNEREVLLDSIVFEKAPEDLPTACQ